MDVYILDSLLRRVELIDKFESFIWTERYAEIGDFELRLMSNLSTRGLFTTGTRIATNNSYRVMTIETVEDSVDSDGKIVLDVKGRSLETLLEDRVAKDTMANTVTDPKWIIEGTPGDVARTMFDHICRDGALDLADVIPFLQPGTIFPDDTLNEPGTPIIWEQSPDTLFNAIRAVVDPYDLGFRLVRNFDTSQLYFDVYAGNDRTTRQTLTPPVIFGVHMDNLQNTKEFNSIQNSKNVAYVFSDFGVEVVYGEGVDPDVEGFERRVLLVSASNVTADTVDISAALIQQGQEALARSRALSLFDGELNQNGDYRYGVDYELGDLVEMRSIDGVISYKRVTEQIFVDDAEGERSYPTLSMDLFTAANTWLSYTNNPKVWADWLDEHWAEM